MSTGFQPDPAPASIVSWKPLVLETGPSTEFVLAVQTESSEALSQPWQSLLLVKASLILFLAFSWLCGYT
jgi:hypothetical protein